MSRFFVFWWKCGFSLLFVLKIFTAQSQSSDVLNIWNNVEYEAASISFVLYDVKAEKEVLSLNGKKVLIPASTMKLFTTATALEKWGPFFRFETLIYYTGTIDKDKKILNGNLIIKGLGDPTTASEYFFDEASKGSFVDSIYQICLKNNIVQINGKVITDISAFTDEIVAPASAWEDMANYYSTGAHALSLFDNRYLMHFRSPAESGKSAIIFKVEPFIPDLKLDNRVLSSDLNEDMAYVFAAPFSGNHIVRGTIPKMRTDFVVKGAIPNPALYYAYFVDSVLNEKNLFTKQKPEFSLRPIENLKFLGRLYSPSLNEIVNKTNKRSLNHCADQLAANLSYSPNSQAGIREGVNYITGFWKAKQMPANGFFMADGSGLSRHNSLSANQLVFMLNYMFHSENYAVFANSMPVNGLNGTLKSFGGKQIPAGVIWAKTGSFRAVRSLAGYMRAKSGKDYAFALIINNYDVSASIVKNDMEAFLADIFEKY